MRLVLFSISILIFPFMAYGQPFDVLGRNLDIASIDNYCFVDTKLKYDKVLLDQYKKTLKHPDFLASLQVRCKVLDQYRNHVSSWKKYFTSLPKLDFIYATNVLPNSVEEDFKGKENIVPEVVCPAMYNQPTFGTLKDLKVENTKVEILSNLKVGINSSFGIFETDNLSCYSVSLLKTSKVGEDENIQLSILAPQILNGVAVLHNYTTYYENYETIEDSVKSLKKFVNAQHSNNTSK